MISFCGWKAFNNTIKWPKIVAILFTLGKSCWVSASAQELPKGTSKAVAKEDPVLRKAAIPLKCEISLKAIDQASATAYQIMRTDFRNRFHKTAPSGSVLQPHPDRLAWWQSYKCICKAWGSQTDMAKQCKGKYNLQWKEATLCKFILLGGPWISYLC